MDYEEMFCLIEKKNPKQLAEVAVYCGRDAQAPLLLLAHLETVLESRLFSQLTRCTVSKLMRVGQQQKIISKLNERLFLSKFYLNEYAKETSTGSYQGATVIEPVSGYHDEPVGCLDFASLYPSIMIEQNIDFSTYIFPDDLPKIKKDSSIATKSISSDLGVSTFVQSFQGVLPQLEQELLAARKAVKKQMKAASGQKKSILNKRQLGIKVLCNSVYGFVGCKHGKLALRQLAASVTARGREMIFETRDVCRKKGFQVVYGDTDSVMIKLPNRSITEAWNECLELETYFGREVFKNPSIILEAEKIMYPFLLETKKRYISRMFENPKDPTKFKVDTKGIEAKRTDCTPLLKRFQLEVIECIMPTDLSQTVKIESTRERLLDLISKYCLDMIHNKIDVSEYILSKTAKNNYKGSLPEHMVVLHRHNSRIKLGQMKGDVYASGDRPEYVILYDPSKKKISEKVECPKWIMQNPDKKFVIDRLHYFKVIRTAITKLVKFHLPKINDLFDACEAEIKRSVEKIKNIQHYITNVENVSTEARINMVCKSVLKHDSVAPALTMSQQDPVESKTTSGPNQKKKENQINCTVFRKIKK